MNFSKFLNVFILICLIFVINTSAAIPRTIAYQGILTDQAGNPLADDKHNVGFSLYDAETGGTLVWGEEVHEVTTSKGLFAVLLGSTRNLAVPFDKQYWIEIKVNSKVLSPRIPLTAGAYSFRADTADVAKSVVGLSGMLNEKAATGHQHSVLVKQGGRDSAVTVDTAGRVGIGTGFPTMKLNVTGGELGVSDVQYPNINVRLDCATTGMGKLKFTRWDGGTHLYNAWIGHFFNQSNSQYMLGFASGAVDGTQNTGNQDSAMIAMAIAQNGNVGIGTKDPLQKFVVSDSGTDGFEFYLRQPTGTVGLQTYNRETNLYCKMQLDASLFSFGNGYGGYSRVGIGTKTPKYALDIYTTYDEDAQLALRNSGTGNAKIYFDASDGDLAGRDYMWIGQNNDLSAVWETDTFAGNITLMPKNGSGNVGVGTRTPDQNYKLDVNGKIQCKGISVVDPTGSVGSICINDGFGGSDTVCQYNFRINYNCVNGKKTALVVTSGWNGGKVGIGDTVPTEILTVSGNIKATGFLCGTSNLCTSDRRYKTDISPIDSSLQKITQLQGVYYNWDTKNYPDKNFSDKKQIGLIAQEVETVLPELVNTDSQGYKSLSYDKLTAVLVEAVKEQQKMIAHLREENDEFKKRIESLEKQ